MLTRNPLVSDPNPVQAQAVAIYLRVSSEEQVRGFSLQGQESDLRRMLGEMGLPNEGIQIYTDAGISSRNKRRPAFEQLRLDLGLGKVKLLAVWAVDRLFRSTRDMLNFHHDVLDPHKVEFLTYKERIHIKDRLDGNTRMILTMLANLAELEWERTSERVRMGKETAIVGGRFPIASNLVPYGFRTKRLLKGRSIQDIEVAPEEAALVQEIFHRVAEESTAQIIADFKRRGIPPIKGQDWYSSFLSKMVRKPAYWGEWSISYRDAQGEKRTMRFQGPSLVSKEEALAAQKALRQRASAKVVTRSYPQGALRPLLRCSHCGRMLYLNHSHHVRKDGTNSQLSYYRCATHKRRVSRERCPYTNQHRMEVLDRQVIATLLTYLEDDEKFRSAIDRSVNQELGDELGKALDEVRTMKRNAEELFVRGKIDLERYEELIAQAERDMRELLRLRPSQFSFDLSNLKLIAQRIRQDQVSRAELTELFQALGTRVYVSPRGIERVSFRFPV